MRCNARGLSHRNARRFTPGGFYRLLTVRRQSERVLSGAHDSKEAVAVLTRSGGFSFELAKNRSANLNSPLLSWLAIAEAPAGVMRKRTRRKSISGGFFIGASLEKEAAN